MGDDRLLEAADAHSVINCLVIAYVVPFLDGADVQFIPRRANNARTLATIVETSSPEGAKDWRKNNHQSL